MQELIRISPSSVGDETVQTVNARDLWTALKSGRQFGNWIQEKLDDGPWKEGRDYVVNKFVNNPLGGRPTVDYHISIDMAKHIAMMEKSEPGYLARDYFIECEKKAMAIQTPAHRLPQSFAEALRLAADLEEQKLLLEAKVAEDAPKVEGYNQLLNSDGYYPRRDVAKHLQLKPKAFNQKLIDIGHWTRFGLPTMRAINSGFAVVKQCVDKSGHSRDKPLITIKGQDHYRRMMNSGKFDNVLAPGNPLLEKIGRAA